MASIQNMPGRCQLTSLIVSQRAWDRTLRPLSRARNRLYKPSISDWVTAQRRMSLSSHSMLPTLAAHQLTLVSTVLHQLLNIVLGEAKADGLHHQLEALASLDRPDGMNV